MGAFSAFLEGTCDHMTTFWLVRCKQMTYSSFQKQPSRMLVLPPVPSCPSNELKDKMKVAGGPSMAENYKDSNPPESLMEERAHSTPGSLLLASNIKREMS